MSKFRIVAEAVTITAMLFCGLGYGWTCPGSENETNEQGNYPLGCPLGGIGAGNFNFLPSGLYNQSFIQVSSDAAVMPTCVAFEKRGNTTFSATLQNAGNLTTTFTAYWPTVYMKYHQTSMLDSISLEMFFADYRYRHAAKT